MPQKEGPPEAERTDTDPISSEDDVPKQSDASQKKAEKDITNETDREVKRFKELNDETGANAKIDKDGPFGKVLSSIRGVPKEQAEDAGMLTPNTSEESSKEETVADIQEPKEAVSPAEIVASLSPESAVVWRKYIDHLVDNGLDLTSDEAQKLKQAAKSLSDAQKEKDPTARTQLAETAKQQIKNALDFVHAVVPDADTDPFTLQILEQGLPGVEDVIHVVDDAVSTTVEGAQSIGAGIAGTAANIAASVEQLVNQETSTETVQERPKALRAIYNQFIATINNSALVAMNYESNTAIDNLQRAMSLPPDQFALALAKEISNYNTQVDTNISGGVIMETDQQPKKIILSAGDITHLGLQESQLAGLNLREEGEGTKPIIAGI
ncbi:hypothetical protein COU76_01885 [Candidatus Peregrinibacteria bacterium CG10_big_fil_rev_8_21_14_0_10_49_10]|nr:MAG: hypothetical protein COU76_01885 [Candidatus Peregrinibacteria bacterium CG10_big_fil_rev_8_21_14_0_10_49_10]